MHPKNPTLEWNKKNSTFYCFFHHWFMWNIPWWKKVKFKGPPSSLSERLQAMKKGKGFSSLASECGNFVALIGITYYIYWVICVFVFFWLLWQYKFTDDFRFKGPIKLHELFSKLAWGGELDRNFVSNCWKQRLKLNQQRCNGNLQLRKQAH